jgi:hypothetical protein
MLDDKVEKRSGDETTMLPDQIDATIEQQCGTWPAV